MIELNPMTETEYQAFMEVSMEDHIRGQIKAGYWQPEEAQNKMQQMADQVLPEGYATPGHKFFAIRDPESSADVGGLWYWVTEQEGQQVVFVVDIQVTPIHRRKGYGSQAFLAMEDQVKAMGIKIIALNVFAHNTSARAMYEKLGYVGEGESMMKQLED
jgi:GNAT superfamily N-acetyltransferase